ncbi:RNA polymerase sigma factor [Streptomyces sirii]|uniref:RNA polymerase sigma factor n=1 Tax=Streptomyces sirii TaxID=3127701 RepID=UPI003D367767
MNDRGMVAAMQASDPQGLAEAYDTYAHRLYGYCCSVLHNPDAAADALQDTFVLANERIAQLRNPERLRPWLYAIARNECLHQLRGQRRTAAIEEAGEVRDETVDLDADLRTEELRKLVQDAFDGLNTRDREVLELAMRQDLQGSELAAALGLSLNHTHALLSRARQQLEGALAAVIVARNGRRDCAELTQMLDAWDGTMTILMRKRINRHIAACEICAERKHRDVSAASLLTLLPVPVLSPTFRDQVIEVVTGPQHEERRREVTERARRFDANGFPVPLDRWVRRMSPTPAKMAAAGAAGVGILVAGPFLWASGGPGQGPGEDPPGPQVTRIEPGGTVPPGAVLGPGDVVNGRTLAPGETYKPGDKVPQDAPDRRPHRGSTNQPGKSRLTARRPRTSRTRPVVRKRVVAPVARIGTSRVAGRAATETSRITRRAATAANPATHRPGTGTSPTTHRGTTLANSHGTLASHRPIPVARQMIPARRAALAVTHRRTRPHHRRARGRSPRLRASLFLRIPATSSRTAQSRDQPSDGDRPLTRRT